MRLEKCPRCLKEFGWCGILAVVYAARLPMPQSRKQLALFLEDVKIAVDIPRGMWISCQMKNRGSINFDHIVKLLKHYQCPCKVIRFKRAGIIVSLRKWIEDKGGKEPASSYIVNVTGHAVFVRFQRGSQVWEIYDQNGVCRKNSQGWLQRACCLSKKILYIVKIL
jgi:hypothetical protein